jgi:hypothetical protein
MNIGTPVDSNWDGRGCWIWPVTFVVVSPNVLNVVEMLLICVGGWPFRFSAVVPTVSSEIFHDYTQSVQGDIGMVSQIRPFVLSM